jgi:hypothetical protein
MIDVSMLPGISRRSRHWAWMILAAGTLASACDNAVDAAPVATSAAAGTAAADPIDVSIVELIAVPERFRDRWVRLMGFVVIEFEGDAVYLHAEDYEHVIVRNALWLDLRDARATKPGRPGYAMVEGQFNPDVHGHLNLFAGGLSHVQRIDPWGRRSAPKASPD